MLSQIAANKIKAGQCLLRREVTQYSSQKRRWLCRLHVELALLSIERVEGEVHLAIYDGVGGHVEGKEPITNIVEEGSVASRSRSVLLI